MDTALLVPALAASHFPDRHEPRPNPARLLHVGWRNLHPDASPNFQLNRWLAYGGESWLADVQPALASLTGYDAWRDAFLALGERALSGGRQLDAALHLSSPLADSTATSRSSFRYLSSYATAAGLSWHSKGRARVKCWKTVGAA